MSKQIGYRIAKVLQNIGTSLGNIFIIESHLRSKNNYKYKPFSYQEDFYKDKKSLKEDWEAVGHTLGEYIGK